MTLIQVLGVVCAGLGFSVLCFAAYVRLAATDPALWHKSGDPKPPGRYAELGGYTEVRVVQDDHVLIHLDEIIRATPRTQPIAGTIDDDRITYVTRSAIWSFPDFTTVSVAPRVDAEGVVLTLYGRLRFGRSDLGVNRARITGWLAMLDAQA